METIDKIFELQKQNQFKVANTSVSERKAKLKKLKYAVEVTFRTAIQEALWNDFHKPKQDVDLSEIFVVTSEIKHAISHLGNWMAKHGVGTPLALMGSSSYIKYEPKGVCLIISPWNFPINLTFGPLVSAIAAGNTCIIKPSEMTPHTSTVIKTLIESIFDQDEIAVIEGAVEVSTHLLTLPFNHIFFTGSPAVGKVVMAAAAKNLSSVTLELGGKSPTIIDETADVKTAAKRIAWGKYFNSGQICITPDYVFVHESKKDAFVMEMRKYTESLYGQNAEDSADYTHIVNQNHADRINALLSDAVAKGGTVLMGGQTDQNYIAPTLICDVPETAKLMNNEIFGPVMPIKTYQNKEDVINYINDREKPLALYIYSKSQNNIDYFIDNTRAGGTCINNNAVHFFNNNLPFGGSNNSGIGKSHGFFGFQEFSNARGIMRQLWPGALELLMPPYDNLKTKIIELTVKYF